MSTTLRDAIYKAKKHDGLLNQTEYNELMKWAKIRCAEGCEDYKTLLTALINPLKLISEAVKDQCCIASCVGYPDWSNLE